MPPQGYSIALFFSPHCHKEHVLLQAFAIMTERIMTQDSMLVIHLSDLFV